jgi:uncharacterized membrane protein
MPDRLAPRWAPWVTLPLALAGLGLSAYLTVVHYTEPTALACPATGAINCTKVTTSAQSAVLGVPVAVIGIVYFLAMAALLVPAAWRTRSPAVGILRLGGAVAGIGMVLWLVYAELVILHAVCLWCTAVHVLTFALFVAVVAATTWVGGLDEDGRGRRSPTSRQERSTVG